MSTLDDLEKLIDRFEDENEAHSDAVDIEELRHEKELKEIVSALSDIPQQFEDELKEMESGRA